MDDEVLEVARLLACPARLWVLRALAERALGVVEIAQAVGIAPSTAHRHLGLLEDAGMIRGRRCGRRRVFRLARRKWFVAMDDSPSGSTVGEDDRRG